MNTSFLSAPFRHTVTNRKFFLCQIYIYTQQYNGQLFNEIVSNSEHLRKGEQVASQTAIRVHIAVLSKNEQS